MSSKSYGIKNNLMAVLLGFLMMIWSCPFLGIRYPSTGAGLDSLLFGEETRFAFTDEAMSSWPT